MPAVANTIPQQSLRSAPALIPGGSIFGATVQGTAGVSTARIEGASGKDTVEGAFGFGNGSTRIFGNDNNGSSGCSGKGKGKGGSSGSCGGKGGKGGGEGGERGRTSSIRYEVLESGSRGVTTTFSLLVAVGLASTLFFFRF